MRRRPLEQAWKMALAVIALTALAMAFYVQLFEVRSRQEEARLAALRLEAALAESRSKLKAEILAELRADLAAGRSIAGPGAELVPGTVLRRPEGGDAAQTLRPSVDPTLSGRPLTLPGLAEAVESLASQVEESDRALRRDLTEFRAAVRGELDASAKVTTLTLVALIPFLAHLLYAFWRDREERQGRAGGEEPN